MDTKLIFAPLVRVSTERQERQGESLRTQHTDLEADIHSLGGEVYEWYQGQEHSTPDYERLILEKLMEDARQGRFHAVIIWTVDRWSRDNNKSSTYLEELKALGIRFFVRTKEYDLYNPEDFMFLSLSVVIGQYHAIEQSRKSTLNRIARARQGFPCCTLPFGRTFDKITKTWGIDPQAQERVIEVAKLYLSGDYSWRTLGEKFSMNFANLALLMRERCGDNWDQHFVSKKNNIHEVVPTPVPRLLPERTIQAIRQKSADKATWDKKSTKVDYLFSRIIFDAETGFTLSGTCNSRGARYYQASRSQPQRYAINAELIEQTILSELFEVLSSQESLRAAVFSGNPVGKVAKKLEKEVTGKQKELGRVEAQLEGYATAIGKADSVPAFMSRIMPRITELEGRAAALKDEIGILQHRLSSLPSDEEIEARRGKWAGTLEAVKESYLTSGVALDSLPFTEKQKIIRLLFGGKDETGKRFGIYVTCLGGSPRRYKFICYGRLGSVVGSLTARKISAVAFADIKDSHEISDSIAKAIESVDMNANSSCPTPPPR